MAEKTTYVIELNDKLSPGLKKATAKALGLDKAMGGVGKKAKKSSGGVGALGASVKGLIGPLALAAAGMKAFQFASESIGVARKFEGLTNAINFTSGSVEEGAKTMDFLRQRSELLGTDLLSSVNGFKTLSAAMIGTSLEGQATKDIFDGVQVAASSMGLTAEQSEGAFLALGQMVGKGKVSMEELRGQLGERIPGAFNIAARAMKMTTKELDKLVSSGGLDSADFLPKFSDELKRTFSKALPAAVNSSQAQFNRFNNSMLELKITLGKRLMPLVNGLMDGFKRVMNFLKRNKAVILDALQPLIDHVKSIRDGFISLGEQIGFTGSASEVFATALALIKKGLQFLKPMLTASKDLFFAIFENIIKVGKSLGGFLERFPIIGKTFFGFVSLLREGFLIIKENAITVLGGVGDLLAGIFSGNLDQIKKGLSSIGKGAFKDHMVTQGGRMAKAFKKGFNAETGLSEVTLKGKVDKGGSKLDEVLETTEDKRKRLGDGTNALTGDKTKKSTSLTGVKGGRPTHINIDIGKLIENFNITTQNMEETTSKVGDKISQVLLSAVNNVNNIAQ